MRPLSSAHSTAHAALAFANCWLTNCAALCCSQSSENRSDSAVLRSESRALLTWERSTHWWIYTWQQELNHPNFNRSRNNAIGQLCSKSRHVQLYYIMKKAYFESHSFKLNLLQNENFLVVMLKHLFLPQKLSFFFIPDCCTSLEDYTCMLLTSCPLVGEDHSDNTSGIKTKNNKQNKHILSTWVK